MQAVTFDLWYTLIWYDTELAEYYRRKRAEEVYHILKPFSPNLNLESVGTTLTSLPKRLESRGRDTLEIHPSERMRIVAELLGVDIPSSVQHHAAMRLSNAGFDRMPYPNQEANAALESLHRQHVKIGMITNTERDQSAWRKVLERYGISQYFDVIATSCEVGHRKPKRQIFTNCLERLGVDAASAFHVGDNTGTDVEGALAAGMSPILYTGLWNRYLDGDLMKALAAQHSSNPNVHEINDLRTLVDLL